MNAAITELNQHAADELRHAALVADRIIQLGGVPLLHPEEWLKQSHCGYDLLKIFDVVSILKDAIKGTMCHCNVF